MQEVEPNDPAGELIALGAATIGEAGGSPMAPRIHRVWPGAVAAGPAYTASCPAGDNLAIHVALANAPARSVLVVELGGEAPYGYWGEVLTTSAQARGIAGLVIDGGVRDVDALQRRGFPVFATTIALRGANKVGPGQTNGIVRVGDVEVAPGDWVVGDADGVAVIAADQLNAVLDAGQARAAREQQLFHELEAGKTTVEVLGLPDSV